jgi:transcriptional regulator with XRE-family HTH domain
MMDRAAFGAHIRKLRTDRGLTQAVCARAAGINVGTWQTYEYGAIPQATRAPAIARALGIPIAALCEQPNGRTPIADLYISADTLARIRSQGAPAIERAAAELAEQAKAALARAATPPVVPRTPTGPKPRPVAREVRARLSRWA